MQKKQLLIVGYSEREVLILSKELLEEKNRSELYILIE